MPIGYPYRGLGTPAGTLTTVAWHENARTVVSKTETLFGSGTLTTPNSTSKAITYDPRLAPIGAALTATIIPTTEGSTAELTVFGLVPNRVYAVSAYTKACGTTANSTGVPFQYRLNPTHGSPDSGISLHVRTDAAGAGTSRTTPPFTLTDRVPRSMVMQDETPSERGLSRAAQAGARIACLTLSVR
jgi:Cu-Zn family superoxide dismutase